MNLITSCTCDFLGNRLTLADAGGNGTRWTWDVFGRQTSMVFLSGDRETYACAPWAA